MALNTILNCKVFIKTKAVDLRGISLALSLFARDRIAPSKMLITLLKEVPLLCCYLLSRSWTRLFK